jgi:hypothetical protein
MTDADLPNVAFRDLAVVVVVAQEQGFGRAAAVLGMNPSTTTRAVQRVERSVGVLLFSRTTRSLRLTVAGRRFVGRAERMVNLLAGPPFRRLLCRMQLFDNKMHHPYIRRGALSAQAAVSAELIEKRQ